MTSRTRSLSWAVLLVGVVILVGLAHGPAERPRRRGTNPWHAPDGKFTPRGYQNERPVRQPFTVPLRWCGKIPVHPGHLWQSAGNPEKRRRGSNYWCEGVRR